MEKETLAIQHGYAKEGPSAMAVPIYQSTAFDFNDTETAANRFALKEIGPIYSRLTNPTTEVLEKRLAAVEGGQDALVTSSGQAAIFYAISNLAAAGENILVAQKIYGGATTLLTHTLKRFGIEARLFDADNADDLEQQIDDNSRAIFFESLSNPQLAIPNFNKIAAIAQAHRIVSICDNTVATPFLCNPFALGIDVVTHSLSKYVGGQGLYIGGAVVERNDLNTLLKNNPRYCHFNEPDASYHGLVYAALPLPMFSLRMRLSLLRDIGACSAPFNSWLAIQGLETAALRISQHSNNALKIAEFLEQHPQVSKVNYPGLSGDRYHQQSKKYFKNGASSGLLSFELADFATAKMVADSTNIFSVVVNIGDSKSLIVHPASTTHMQVPQEALAATGVNDNLIRLSVGLENIDDLLADLTQALNKVPAPAMT